MAAVTCPASSWKSLLAGVPYPTEAPVGPLVLVTNELAGSDVFTHGWTMLGLGPIVGTRTWGGVIGIETNQRLVDRSLTTQPEYAFWLDDVGWGVENVGAFPEKKSSIPRRTTRLSAIHSSIAP